MLRDVSINQVRAHLTPYLSQQLRTISDTMFPQKFANYDFADGKILDIRDVNQYGRITPGTLTLTLTRYSNVGIFQGHHCFAKGTNVMTSRKESMDIPIREITGDVVLCYHDLNELYKSVMEQDPSGSILATGDVSKMELLRPDQLDPLISGYRNYVETYGYTGDLALGINGLSNLPGSSYTFPSNWSSLSGEALVSAIIDPISAVTSSNYAVNLRRLLLPTTAFNTIRTKFISGTSDSVLKALLNDGSFDSVERIPGLDFGFNNTPTGLYLPPLDDYSLFYGTGGDMLVDMFNESDGLIIRGYAVVAGAVSTEPGNVLFATGM